MEGRREREREEKGKREREGAKGYRNRGMGKKVKLEAKKHFLHFLEAFSKSVWKFFETLFTTAFFRNDPAAGLSDILSNKNKMVPGEPNQTNMAASRRTKMAAKIRKQRPEGSDLENISESEIGKYYTGKKKKKLFDLIFIFQLAYFEILVLILIWWRT